MEQKLPPPKELTSKEFAHVAIARCLFNSLVVDSNAPLDLQKRAKAALVESGLPLVDGPLEVVPDKI